MADTSEILGIIDRAIKARGIKEAEACRQLGLKRDGIRTIRRGHVPKVETLHRLASWLDMPISALERTVLGRATVAAPRDLAPPRKRHGSPPEASVHPIDDVCTRLEQMLADFTDKVSRREFSLAKLVIERLSEQVARAHAYCVIEAQDETERTTKIG